MAVRDARASASLGILAAVCGCASVAGLGQAVDASTLSPAASLFAAEPERDIGEVDTAARPRDDRFRFRLGMNGRITGVQSGPFSSGLAYYDGNLWHGTLFVEVGKKGHSFVGYIGGLFGPAGGMPPPDGYEWQVQDWRVYYRRSGGRAGKWDWFWEAGAAVMELKIQTPLLEDRSGPAGYVGAAAGVRLWLTEGGLEAFAELSVGFLLGPGATAIERQSGGDTERYLKPFCFDPAFTAGVTF